MGKSMENFTEQKNTLGLYDPQFEHDACGIGAVVDIKGRKSHQTVDDALSIVERLEHRAGKDAEGKTGDGVGILLQISHKFFSKVAEELNISLGNEREYGVGMFFFPQSEHLRAQAMKLFEVVTRKEGLEFLAWRKVPVNPDAVGQKARDCMPAIWQCFIKKPAKVSKGIDFDRKLYIVRRVFEQASNGTYVPSLSSRTIVYKGMFLVHDLRLFYTDLQDEDYESAIGMVHSRFSTNTNPSWMRAHPNRFILHNGEINTIKGNTDAMLAREESISSSIMQDDMNKILPIINTSGSDSAMLDNALEFMVMNGMDLPLAVMITIPEPWENNKNISQKKRDFYQYYATMLEPWDGPAAILFSDGDVMGAVLDRNGLRPSRYYITKDGRMILSSEVGVLECEPDNILVKDRLRPGKMLLVDTVKGEVVDDEKLKEFYASREPYGEWIDRNLVELARLKIPNVKVESYTGDQLTRLQKVFGYKYEDVNTMILSMARAGAEPSGAMGTDTPLAVLSNQHPPLFNYFKQRFAQVTNPPIDAIREKVVTSTSVYIGAHGNLLEDKPENCKVLKVHNPILTSTDLLKIKYMNVPGFKVATVSINYYKNTSLEKAIDRVFLEVDRAYKDGANIIILSDRDVDEYHVTIPSLLAVSAVSQYLIRTKKSTALALILESAEPREVHHFAALLGYGACAINPYLAHETIGQLIDEGLLDKDYYAAVEDYDNAILSGIVKIASKMGISTTQIPERWCSENGIPVPAFPRTSGTRLLHKYHNTVQNHRRRFRGDVRLFDRCCMLLCAGCYRYGLIPLCGPALHAESHPYPPCSCRKSAVPTFDKQRREHCPAYGQCRTTAKTGWRRAARKTPEEKHGCATPCAAQRKAGVSCFVLPENGEVDIFQCAARCVFFNKRGRRRLVHKLSFLEQQDFTGNVLYIADYMCGNNNDAVMGELGQYLTQAYTFFRVQSGGRLIHDEDLRLTQQCGGSKQTLFHAAGICCQTFFQFTGKVYQLCDTLYL